MDGKFRSNLRRRRRKLETGGPVRTICTHAADASLERFYLLEQSGWKGKEGSAIACNGDTRRFYDDIAHVGERFGYFALYALECGGRTIAMQYGLVYGGRYALLKPAYDEAFAECSPGQLITHDVLADLAARGYSECDFMGELDDWKTNWAPRVRAHANWYVFRGSGGRVVKALRFCLRPAVAKVVKSARRRVLRES